MRTAIAKGFARRRIGSPLVRPDEYCYFRGMRVGCLAAMFLAGGCGLFPDVSGLTRDASSDASDTGDALPSDPLRVVNVWNNIDATGVAASISVAVQSVAGDALVACVREGTNDGDQFTVTDDAAQTWVRTASGYEHVNSFAATACFTRASSAALGSVTASFTTAGGVANRSIIVLEI